ncbi:MAG: protein kinase [Candidatus Manganitrophus sp. SA1]|nr:protein kinase [Candidatus Manganitrophus morganii]
MENQLFSGKYEIQGEIARGGMGIVYKAIHKSLNRTVALKVLHAQYTGDTSFVKRFQREARAMARLDHENVIRVYDVSEDQNAQYIVMEFFPGKDLKQVILEKGPLSLEQALSVALQMAEALAYAHAQGIVHRDIKPSNVMVDSRGRVKLADFGIAAATDEISVTATGQIIGTPEYMSPEQARGEAMDGRSDLYSLGIVLYEMLTGTTPFERLSRMSIIAKLIYEPQEFNLTFPDHIPSPIQTLVQSLLRKQAQERVSDAATLIEKIRNLGNENPDEDTLDRTMTRAISLPSDATPAPGQPVDEEESTTMLPGRADTKRSAEFSSLKTPPPLQRPSTGKFTPVPLPGSDFPEKTHTLSPPPPSGQTHAGQGQRLVPIFAGVVGLVVLIVGGVYFFSSDSESAPEPVAAVSPPPPRPVEQPAAPPEPAPAPLPVSTPAPPEPKQEDPIETARVKANEIEADARKAQSDVSESNFEADRLDARHRASQLYLHAADLERKGAKAFQEGSELMNRKQYEEAGATLEKAKEFFVRADQGFKKAKEEAQMQLAKATSAPSPKPIKKEAVATPKTAPQNPAKPSGPPPPAETKIAKQTPPTPVVPARPDIEVVGEILSKLKKAYEGRDMAALMQISNLSDGRTRILQEIFRDHPVVKVSIANFSLAGELASANVVITRLVDQNGKVVSPPDEWKQSKVLIRKEGAGWGKVLW